tara:strand:+ start:153 stop:572 length:420 start_codon:yes stop_codon:yes gene_type:complete
MANLGEIAEIVNASELTLEVGSDNYILLTDLDLHIGRPEDRVATTDNVLYTYGKGDNWFTATLIVSTPELSSLNTLGQIDSDGDMTSTAWKIVAKNVSGATKTFSATGILREFDIRKPSEGKVNINIFVRITGDTISIS